jgi:2-oxoglutarate ferredoxin oxidoreductase subunit delta
MNEQAAVVEAKTRPVRKSKIDYSQGPAPVSINEAWCKACNICISLCPQNVLAADADGKPVVAQEENCMQCGACWTHCPDFAIKSNYR